MNSSITYREYCPEDAEGARTMLNKVFPAAELSRELWHQRTAGDFTAPVALDGDKIIGVIPHRKVNLQVASGAAVNAWVQHRVGTDETYRGQGVGNGMQDCVKAILKNRADVLMVYRGAERSGPYKFYDKNGLHDVTYPKTYRLAPAPEAPGNVRKITVEEFFNRGSGFLDLFSRAHNNLGGFPIRNIQFYRDRFADVIAVRGPDTRFDIFVVESDGQLAGYLIAGAYRGMYKVMETVSENWDGDILEFLFAAFRTNGKNLYADVTPGSAIEGAVIASGGTTKVRNESATAIMVHIYDIASTGKKVWNSVPELENVTVKVWTPQREGVIHAAADNASGREIVLEMKEHALSRLLMRRLSLKSAIAEERITATGVLPGDLDYLTSSLTPCLWQYHYIDHI